MGLNDRDYARTPPGEFSAPSRGGGFSSWEVWKKILAANIAVFVLQIFVTRPVTEADVRMPELTDEEILWQMESYEETFAPLRDQASAGDEQGDSDGGVADPAESEESDAISEQTKQRIDKYRERTLRQRLKYAPRVSLIQEWFQLDSEKLMRGQVWRLVTCGFCHDRMGIWHLVFNMLFLYWFGRRLELKYGSHEFTVFYFAALIVASLSYVALDIYTGTNIPAIGASGAVWGVTALYALLYPYERIHIYFLFPVEIRWLVLIKFLFDLHPVLLAIGGEGMMYSGVGHAAHVGGAIFGFLYWYRHWELMPIVSRLPGGKRLGALRQPRANRNRAHVLKIHREEQESARLADQEEMDRILEKISRDGRESLSDEELMILEETSKQIRQQRGQ